MRPCKFIVKIKKMAEALLRKRKLKKCCERVQEVANEVIPLYRSIQLMIFAPVNSDVLLSLAQLWMADAGRSAESGMSATLFEKLERAMEAKQNPNLNKILYWFDVEAWLNAVQDRISTIEWMLYEFYGILSSETKIDDSKIDRAYMYIGEDGRKCYMAANAIFINLASVFDILSKVACELESFSQYDFKTYPKIASKDTIYRNQLRVSPQLRQPGMLFETPEQPIIRKIETLRNEYVHNGPWDRSASIYCPSNDAGEPMPEFMLMPDMKEDGNFPCVKNRNKFYSEGKKLNEELIPIVEETLDVIEKTLNGINDVAIAQTAAGNDEKGLAEAMKLMGDVVRESGGIIVKEFKKK